MKCKTTELYLAYTEEMERAGYEVFVHEWEEDVLIKNKYFNRDIMLRGSEGRNFIAEAKRIWYRYKEMPLEVAFTGLARSRFNEELF